MLRETKKQDTRDKIVRHAIELFKQKGFEHVTVDEITAVCGIAKGTFFNYFPKKEHVLLHLADSYAKLLRDIAARHRDADFKERLLMMFRDLLLIYEQHAGLLRLTLLETMKAAVSSPDGSANLAAFEQTLRELVEDAGRDGVLRAGLDAAAVAAVLAALFYQALMYAPGTDSADALTGRLRLKLDLLWEGIAYA